VARVSTATRLAPTDGPRLRTHVSSAINLHQVGGPQVAPLAVPLKAIPKKQDRASQFSIKRTLICVRHSGAAGSFTTTTKQSTPSRGAGYNLDYCLYGDGIERLTRA
jgi:hypothetical protein